MIITDEFVFINYPKTGSTFVRSVFTKISTARGMDIPKKRWLATKKFETRNSDNLRDYPLKERWLKPSPHGLRCQIPKEHADKKIVSVMRNPFERLVSLYEYGDWKKNCWLDREVVKKKYKDYPNVNFLEFLEIRRDYPYYKNFPYNNSFPELTTFFLNFFFFFTKEDPIYTLNHWNEQSLDKFKEELKDVTFLKNSNLNQELYNLLKAANYPEKYIDWIVAAQKVNTSKKADKSYRDYYNNDSLQISKKESQLILDIFPEYLNFLNDSSYKTLSPA